MTISVSNRFRRIAQHYWCANLLLAPALSTIYLLAAAVEEQAFISALCRE